MAHDFGPLFEKARAAGLAAGNTVTPPPMGFVTVAGGGMPPIEAPQSFPPAACGCTLPRRRAAGAAARRPAGLARGMH